MEGYFVGIDIGKTNLRIAVTGLEPNFKYFAKKAYRRSCANEMQEQITEAVEEALREGAIPSSLLAGIGICVPAIVSRPDGTIQFGPDFESLKGHSLNQFLYQRYKVPVAADIDTVVATWGENWVGTGRTCNRFALITWGTGVGAGLVLDGKVYEGPNNLFAEFGHSVVSDDDWPCKCGAVGCLDSLASGTGIAEHARRALLSGRKTILRDLCENQPETLTCPMVFEAAEENDPVALGILERVAVLLGRLASNLVYTIQPEKIVIVGGLAERAEWILDTMRNTMQSQCWLIFRGFTHCDILPSTLGDTAGVLGAIRMVQLKTNNGNA